MARLFWDWDVVVLEGPLPHEPDARWSDPVDDQGGVVWLAEVPSQKRVVAPDHFQQLRIGEDFSRSRDSHLIVRIVEVAEFHFRVQRNLVGFAIRAKIGDEDRESFGADRRHRSEMRLVAVDGG